MKEIDEYDEPLKGNSEMTGNVAARQDEPLPMENCAQLRPYLHRLVEDELDPMRASRVGEHLEVCPQCERVREELDDERLMVMEALVSAPDLSTRFASKIRQRIEIEAGRARVQARQRWTHGLGSAAAMILVSVVVSVGSGDRSDSPNLAALIPSEPLVRSETMISPGTLVSSETIRSATMNRRNVDLGPLRRLPLASVVTHPVTLPLGGPQPKLRGFVVRTPNGQRTRITLQGARVKQLIPFRLRVTRSRGRVSLNAGHLLALANRLSPKPLRVRPARRDPCRDDPNHDGITDLNDLAYACQLVMGTGQELAAHALETGNGAPRVAPGPTEGTLPEGGTPDGTFTDSECEEYCLRV